MAVVDDSPRLDAGVAMLLASLRARIRRYIWIAGLASAVATLCLAFWLSLGIDWMFEPPAIVRRGLVAIGAIVTAVVFYRQTIERLAVPLSDSRLALLLERRFRYFNDSLLTSVELAHSHRDAGELAREMFAHTAEQAAQRARGVELGEVFDRRPLWRAVVAAVVLAGSIVGLAVASPSTFEFGVERLTGATDQQWPRQTRLVVPGFENGEKVVAKGDDVDVLVQADLSMPRVPDTVHIRFRSEEGVRGRETMVRAGNATAGTDEYQDFRHKFSSVLTSLSFDVYGGDASVRDLQIRVVDSPTISEATLWCEYPAYMNRAPRELPVTGSMQVPLGTRVTFRGQASKDLVRARLEYPVDDKTTTSATVDLPGPGDSLRNFEFALPELAADMTLAFTLEDTDGIQNRVPIVVSLSGVADEPPQVSVELRGIGTAITPQARLPVAGKILDDYGITSTAFQATVDGNEPRESPLAGAPAGQAEFDVDEAFEARDLKLKAGQKVLFGLQARDAYHLADGDQPHTASSARFELDVVSPETLRAMLESRELNLRQRFETIIGEVTETRDLLADGEAKEKDGNEPQDEPAADNAAKEGQPVDQKPAGKGTSVAALRIERAKQNSEKNGQETLGVAGSFDEMREELINNRVDTEELRVRLKDQIADPLRAVGETMFPEWDRRLTALAESLSDPAKSEVARREAQAQGDKVLVEMERIRDKMLELESFNEAIDMLRSIIDSEKSLQEQIRERQKRKVRDLLEEDSK